jgi:hypothetical protein
MWHISSNNIHQDRYTTHKYRSHAYTKYRPEKKHGFLLLLFLKNLYVFFCICLYLRLRKIIYYVCIMYALYVFCSMCLYWWPNNFSCRKYKHIHAIQTNTCKYIHDIQTKYIHNTSKISQLLCACMRLYVCVFACILSVCFVLLNYFRVH